jgi:Rieske Fe-S protein
MNRRVYLKLIFGGFVSVLIAACKKEKKSPIQNQAQPSPLPVKKLVLTNRFPSTVYSNEQLKITWIAEQISSIAIDIRYGNGNWENIAYNLQPNIGEFTISFPPYFAQTGLITISVKGDNIERVSPGIEKWNTFIIDANVETELLTIGAIKQFNINSLDLFVKRENAQEIKCFSALCTHAGCPISFIQTSNKFNCSCHGSQFDTNGNVLMGPASDPLNTFACETIAPEKFRILY